MASRRYLKKVINSQIANVIDRCYDVIASSPKSEEKMTKVIDEAVELYDELIGAINDYKTVKNKSSYFIDIENKLMKGLDSLNGKVSIL